MELRESAEGAALGDWTSWSDGCHLDANSETANRAVERTGPDVHLIKQVERVTKSASEGPIWRFARIPSMGVTDAVEILVLLIWQLLHWLLFGCKNSQAHPEEAGRPVCEGTVWSLSVAAEVIVDSRTFFSR